MFCATIPNLKNISFLAFIVLVCLSCRNHGQYGLLKVKAPESGQYEIYKIDSEHPLQFTSEKIGVFNETLELEPGHYLIMADCSSETLIINPDEFKTLVAHKVAFTPPTASKPSDLFSIQCDRHVETQSRQSHTGRFDLFILSGDRELLVGTVPFRPIKLAKNRNTPKVFRYSLSSIMVQSFPNMKPGTRYFVSPKDGLISVTQNQRFGYRLFLLPGSYTVEVNGTQAEVKLKPLKQKIVYPSFLRLSVSSDVDLFQSSQIRGTPLHAELNNQHHIDLNETYPVIPGHAHIRLSNSGDYHPITLKEKELTAVQVRSLIVNGDCPAWDWTCLGRLNVYLFSADKPYPIASGVTDVPILFLQDKVSVSLEGTKDIKRTIPDHIRDSELNLARIHVTPRPVFKNGHLTDLVRIETDGETTTGQSFDFNLKVPESIALIEGDYILGQYETIKYSEGERKKTAQAIRVRRNRILKIRYNVVLPDMKSYKKQSQNHQNHKSRERQEISIRQLIPNRFY